MIEINQHNSYDEMAYESYPYMQSSPEKIATLGVLFGMTPPKIETARVLELGCASGGNIIPHAVRYPKGEYIGIDLSQKQIDDGKENIKILGLKNIELKHYSITDIDESFGKFDYIICHGVFSWVPDFVRDKILEISSKNLTKNGIAYISYNTLPGWNMVRTVRDMMQYHARGFEKSIDKVVQSRALLAFVKESLEGMDTAYAKMLRDEAELLSKQADTYIRHEHLEDDNVQFYFSDFIKKASEHNLQYLSDAALTTMYVGNMKPSVAEKLKDLNDIVKTEQYLDFINNRRFRSTLLCHQGIPLNRALNNDSAKKFALSLDVTPEKPLNIKELENNEPVKFFFKNDQKQYISTASPYLKAVFYVFAENKSYPLKFNSLVEKANKLFKTDKKNLIEADLFSNAMNLIIKGYIDICLIEKDKAKVNLDKPCLNNLALHQVNHAKSNWITSINHSAVAVNLLDKYILKYMDGNNDKEQIIDYLIKELEEGKFTVSKDNVQITDKKEIRKELSAHVENTVKKFSDFGIFE